MVVILPCLICRQPVKRYVKPLLYWNHCGTKQSLPSEMIEIEPRTGYTTKIIYKPEEKKYFVIPIPPRIAIPVDNKDKVELLKVWGTEEKDGRIVLIKNVSSPYLKYLNKEVIEVKENSVSCSETETKQNFTDDSIPHNLSFEEYKTIANGE